MSLGDVLVVGVLVFVASRLVQAVRASVARRAEVRRLVAGVRPVHFVLAVPALAVVVAVAAVLLSVPGLDVGWWTALGGEGNPVLGLSGGGKGTLLDAVVPAAFLVLLVLALPLLVASEEEIFRRGAETRTWRRNGVRAVWFGLAHALVGIPIGAAIALSVGGVYLTLWYLHGFRRSGTQAGALAASSRAHLAYNAVIVVLVAVALATGV